MEFTCEVTTSGIGSPSAAGNGDKTLALLLVFFMIFVHTALGSTIPFMVTSFLALSMVTASTPGMLINNQKTKYKSAL